ncbi:MAG: AAA family ATPase [Armatimonadetes bacterium]|nr:AAA family ATPase [Armatimonadota bacterium]
MQTLIIVTGHSGAGKTHLSHQIARRFGLMCVNKDDIKETIGDEFHASNREESRRIGRASYYVMDRLMDRALAARLSLVVESNFPADFYTDKVNALRAKYGFQTLQILCWADPVVLLQRIAGRVDRGERHAVHVAEPVEDSGPYLRYLADGKLKPLDIGGELIEFDTTDFGTAGIEPVCTRVRLLLEG